MFRRPHPGETEEDLLQQQNEFFKDSKEKPNLKRKNPESKYKNDEHPKQLGILGDIVEKSTKFSGFFPEPKIKQNTGFPKSFVINFSNVMHNKKERKSLFALHMEKNKKEMTVEKMEIDNSEMENIDISKHQSANVENTDDNKNMEAEINNYNLQKISQMSEEEILREQQKLLQTLDPKLIQFLKKRKDNKKEVNVISDNKIQEVESKNEESEYEAVKAKLTKYLDSRWINLDFIEKEKLEWIGDIPDKKSLEPDQPYSARFDFKGELQPFSKDVDVRSSLYHHGDEPERPGYTIQELYQLSRSQVLQQRILAINTLGNILRKTKLGYYDKCFDGQLLHKLVEADIFFLLRFSIDENSTVPSSIYCLHSLICNESDEFCLDKLLGVTYSDEQPVIFDDLRIKKEEEGELKDQVVISTDLIKGVLRTDLLLRMSYILNNFMPNRETVIRIINCLIRISRHSSEAVTKIYETENLLKIIFLNIKTKQPMYEGVKLFRVMSSYSKEVALKLTKCYDLKFLERFLEAEENSEISKKEFYLLKLESIYFWRILLLNDLLVDEFLVWSPCLVRLLLFYTEKVDLNNENEFDFELFSALVSLIVVCNRKKIQTDSNIIAMMRICLEKWLTQLMQHSQFNFSVCKALGSLFRYFSSRFKAFGVEISDLKYLNKINSLLEAVFQSEIFSDMSSALSEFSYILLNTVISRDPDNLPSLQTVYDGGNDFLRIVHNGSPYPFFISLAKYLRVVYNISHEYKLATHFFMESKNIQKYILKVCESRDINYNWFLKYETMFLINVLQLQIILESHSLMKLGFRLLPLLRSDDKKGKKVLDVILGKKHWKFNVEFLDQLNDVYSEAVLRKPTANYKNDLIPEEWTYKVLSFLQGKEVVSTVASVLKFILIILTTDPKLFRRVSYTHRYYYLCVVFLTDLNVNDETVQNLLEETFLDVVNNYNKLNLNLKISGSKPFYDLYTELIIQYLGVSYGLPIFAKFVLFPLQNTLSVSFKKLVWFEYSHVLRVLTLSFPAHNFLPFEAFIEPAETDESLLVAYINSLSSRVILKARNQFIYNIAVGNINKFLQSQNQDEKLIAFIKRKIDDLNVELKNDILNFDKSN